MPANWTTMLKRRYIHCTDSLDKVIGILKHGLIVRPCPRKVVLDALTDRNEFQNREPQYFGMACLHGFKVLPNSKYWKKYGPYGIELHPSFVENAGFRRVIYLDKDSRQFSRIKSDFDDALRQLDQKVYAKHPNDSFRHMAYTNKRVAALLGARKWADFLTEFEYMEPRHNRFEMEWRYARPEPYYDDRPFSVIRNAVNDDANFARYTIPLKIKRADVLRVHVPFADKDALHLALPEYQGIEINHTLNNILGLSPAFWCQS
jgi:hypothetical protein